MRALIFLLCLLSVAHATEIRDKLSMSSSVSPDVFILPVKVEAKGDSEKAVLKSLAEIDRQVRRLEIKPIESSYSLEKNRVWDEKKKRYVQKGFVGDVFYKFSLKRIDAQDKIVGLFARACSRPYRGAKVEFLIKSPHWEVSQEEKAKVLKSLKLKLLSMSLKEASEFGRQLKQACFIKKVNFTTGYYSEPFFYKGALRESSPYAPEPQKGQKSIKLDAEVVFKCKKGS